MNTKNKVVVPTRRIVALIIGICLELRFFGELEFGILGRNL
jgi:hypothetical protein